jgi:hypothetical protein
MAIIIITAQDQTYTVEQNKWIHEIHMKGYDGTL